MSVSLLQLGKCVTRDTSVAVAFALALLQREIASTVDVWMLLMMKFIGLCSHEKTSDIRTMSSIVRKMIMQSCKPYQASRRREENAHAIGGGGEDVRSKVSTTIAHVSAREHSMSMVIEVGKYRQLKCKEARERDDMKAHTHTCIYIYIYSRPRECTR